MNKYIKIVFVTLPFLAAQICFANDTNKTSDSGKTIDVNSGSIGKPFNSSPQSLSTYQTPNWFRDAKFGIWAHWGPQSVPKAGDWYARNMYVPGHWQYEHHLKNYGHPSKSGYKDIIELWKAEKFNPDQLMRLYKDAGAKYFVSMGVHHDNFDLWNSKYHSWNAVNKGPHRDIVGDWKKSANKYGLRFGVSEHLGASYSWFTPSHGFDQFWGQLGVGYDGENPEYAELYHTGKDKPFRDSKTWYTDNPESQKEWFARISDLVEQYQPDLLYSDGGIPFGEIGRTLVANYYNQSIQQHHGNLEAVYNHKDLGSGEFIRKASVQDVERGVMDSINPYPWQTDTSIGDWFYSEGYKYKTTSEVVHMLTDIVSKNGNLLLNVVQLPDGSLPTEAMAFLTEMAVWMKINGEAIYGTRPWKIYGEGPTLPNSGTFNEEDKYTAQDIRFTLKGSVLYATTLSSPENEVRIKSLGSGSTYLDKPIKTVKLLGYNKNLTWKQEKDALVILLPAQLPTQHASSFKISF